MKKIIKLLLDKATPSFKVNQSLLNFFYRKYEAMVFENLINSGQTSVFSGPFKGLKVQAKKTSKNFRTVHLLGLFETSLHETVERLAKKHNYIINIGCGTGYYTNGIAHYSKQQNNQPKVEGYDVCEKQIEAAKNLQNHNNLKSVEHKKIDFDYSYNHLEGQQAFVIIDIEGGEYPLLSDQKSFFEGSDILIEIHETDEYDTEAGIAYLQNMYKDTHSSTVIDEIKTSNFVMLEQLKKSFGSISYLGMHILSCENRNHAMKWLILEKK